MYKVTELPNGVRVATCEMPHMESVSVGVWVGVGGRYETKANCGISHFIEHMLFKGTRRRSAKEISQAVEGVGGYVNAFTGEEATCFYAKASHRHLGILLDVLADMYQHSRFTVADIEKERTVIKEELLMYRDQPQQYVHELLTQTLWPKHPLGYPVAGTPQSLDGLTRTEVLAFKQSRYLAANTVISVAGHCTHDDIVQRVGALWRLDRTGAAPRFVAARDRQIGPQLHFFTKNVEQTNLAIGIRGYSRRDPRRYALKLLSVVLGENMSSRLFQIVREERGLAYSIQTSPSFFSDTGVVVVSAGLDAKHLTPVLRLVLRELRRVGRQRLAEVELQRAKDYALGQMRLGLESTTNQMMWIGEHLLAYGFVEHPDEIEKRIHMITTEEVKDVAADIFRDQNLNAAVITAGKNEAEVRAALHL